MKKIIIFLLCISTLASCDASVITKGSVEVYSESKLKARDSQRLLDINVISSGIYLYFSEYQEYPLSLNDEKFTVIIDSVLPVDIIEGETKGSCTFGYIYVPDNANMNFRLSSCLEFYQDKALDDGGIYENKFEKFGY